MLTNVTSTTELHHLACPPTPPAEEPPFVTSPLSGKHGQGRAIVIDAEDWAKVRETWGSDWTLAQRH